MKCTRPIQSLERFGDFHSVKLVGFKKIYVLSYLSYILGKVVLKVNISLHNFGNHNHQHNETLTNYPSEKASLSPHKYSNQRTKSVSFWQKSLLFWSSFTRFNLKLMDFWRSHQCQSPLTCVSKLACFWKPIVTSC